ncbi:carotenoid biosynthesis protein [Neolewinella sp.]|uniref:carotenoid biosynthesis protein n=1 Tax=Neolewinella sp. TaxID=2993543 RepID=UPI003B51CDFA
MVFAFASGTLAHTLPAVLPITRYTTDGLLLVLNGLLLYAIYRRNRDRWLLVWLVVAYCFTFAAEAVGVATGALFGEYAYGATMRWQWLGVPFVIALNWCVLTLGCNEVALRVWSGVGGFTTERPAGYTEGFTEFSQRGVALEGGHRGGMTWRSFGVAVVASVLIALYDVAIEPVAVKLDYWQWGGGTIPFRNYVMWAVVALAISLPLQVLGIRFRSPLLLVYLGAQLFFFGVLNLVL